MAGDVDQFNEQDIRIKDLVLDDLFGYREIFSVVDENIIDRQLSLVLLELYGTESNIPSSPHIIIKRYAATATVKRLIPALRTYIATHVERSDVQREGYLTYYDQLNMLNHFEEDIDRRLIQLRGQVSHILAETFAEMPGYEKPSATNMTRQPVTFEPDVVGRGFYKRNCRY